MKAVLKLAAFVARTFRVAPCVQPGKRSGTAVFETRGSKQLTASDLEARIIGYEEGESR